MPWPRRGSCSRPWNRRACSAARLRPRSGSDLVNEAAMTVASQVDEMLRDLAARRLAEFRPELGRGLVGEAIDALLARVEPAAVARKPTTGRARGPDRVAGEDLRRSAGRPGPPDDVTQLIHDAAQRLVDLGVLRDRPDLLTPRPAPLERAAELAGDVLGFARPTLFTRIAEHLDADHDRRLEERIKSLNWELFDRAVGAANWAAIEELSKLARDRKSTARPGSERNCNRSATALDKPFADRLLLWKKTKTDLVEEMSTALQMPGWGNSFTQPIANRIEMLSTGVRLPVAVKVFGSKLDEIQRVSQEIAAVLRGVRGAADVFPDQIVGKGYVEIKIDRKKAARYGINVGDIQDVVEVAMGGRPLTMTVEGRERYPVRVRYARDYRDDVEALKNILVSARGMAADGRATAGWAMGASMPAPAAPARLRRCRSPWPSWPTSGWSRGRR